MGKTDKKVISLVDEGKAIVGIGVVRYLTELVMRFTPTRFDKARFALPVSAGIAIVLSITEAMGPSGDGNILSAVMRGIVVAAGAGGLYSSEKNYRELKEKNNETNSTN